MSKIRSVKAIPLSFRLPEGKTVTLGIGSTIKATRSSSASRPNAVLSGTVRRILAAAPARSRV